MKKNGDFPMKHLIEDLQRKMEEDNSLVHSQSQRLRKIATDRFGVSEEAIKESVSKILGRKENG